MQAINSILVPTDFSECAGFALDTAVKIAQQFDARLYILHVFFEQPDSQKKELLIKHSQQLSSETGIQIDTLLRQGKVPETINDMAKAKSTDLIVMGSHGASGFNELFVGSNAQKVVRAVHVPVLIVKMPLPKIEFSKVAFASAFNQSDKEVFLRFKELVKHFIPEIHLVNIHTSSLFEVSKTVLKEVMDEFVKLAAPLKCVPHIYDHYSASKGIQDFTKENEIELIGISNHQRSTMKRMLMGSTIEAVVNHASTPVLSVDFE